MKLAESTENYLETILILQNRLGEVRSIDIAVEMGFSKPSVSRAVHLLADNDYLIFAENGSIQLTDKGMASASRIYERHLFLHDLLVHFGVSEDVAAADACRMEHVISAETFDQMKAYFPSISREVGERFHDGEFILAYKRESGKKAKTKRKKSK